MTYKDLGVAILSSPTKLHLNFPSHVIDALRPKLTYRDQAAQFQYTRFKNNRWARKQYGEKAYFAELDRLKKLIYVELLFNDKQGVYTHSGLKDFLKPWVGEAIIEVDYPEEGLLAYYSKPKEMRSYQKTAVQALLEAKHGAIECCTGSGKTLIIQALIKHHGLQSVVVTPSKSIARQIFREFKNIFGAKKVGLYGDGKHDLGKLITVGIGASLTRIKEGSNEAKFFDRTQVVLFDESHILAADTVKSVCIGPLRNAPYRFFVSATQMRNDGKDLLLNSLIGPTVFEYPLKQAVDEGYLSKPNFHMYTVPSCSDFFSNDTLEMIRAHVYNNDILHKQAAELANKFVRLCNHQVLIMIENINQFALLIPYLKYETKFAHGGLTAQTKELVDKKYHKADTQEIVDGFNFKEFPILVGTGCVGVGTDFQGVETIIYLQGGKSEIKVSQAVGRGTRKPAGKTEFNFIDFDVDINYSSLRKQAQARREIYDFLYPNN